MQTNTLKNRLAGAAILVFATSSVAGCVREFAPFNELDSLRVLGVRAEPPALGPGAIAVLDALVFEPDGNEVSYRWSWCPLAAGAATGFACYLDEEMLRSIAEEYLPGAGALVPSFDLGTEPVAEFAYPLPASLLRALCEEATSSELPAFVPLPDCSRGLTISVRLEVAAGGDSVVAVKDLPLFWDEADADNSNPEVSGLMAAVGNAAPFELAGDFETVIEHGVRYRLRAGVSLDSAEIFVPAPGADDPDPGPRRERLFMTWFITGGEVDAGRTTFIDGEVGLEVLRTNIWRTPGPGGAPDGSASIYLVLQDERGGVDWLGRGVRLEGS